MQPRQIVLTLAAVIAAFAIAFAVGGATGGEEEATADSAPVETIDAAIGRPRPPRRGWCGPTDRELRSSRPFPRCGLARG